MPGNRNDSEQHDESARALVLERGEPIFGKRINIASDELSGREMAATLSDVVERSVEYVEVPLDRVMAQSEDLGLMFEWFDRVGYNADIVDLRREYPDVGWQTFEASARSHART